MVHSYDRLWVHIQQKILDLFNNMTYFTQKYISTTALFGTLYKVSNRMVNKSAVPYVFKLTVHY